MSRARRTFIAVGAGVWAPFDSLMLAPFDSRALAPFDSRVLAQGRQGRQGRPNAVPDGDWRTINRDLAANRYSPLRQINTSNVSSLKEAWTTRLGGGATSVPLVVNGVMYVSSGTRVVALDGDTGTEIWAHTLQPVAAPAPAAPPTDVQAPSAGAQAPPAGGGGGRGRGGAPAGPTASARGVGYWPGDPSTTLGVVKHQLMKMRMNMQMAGMLVGMDVKGGAADNFPKDVYAKGYEH